MDDGCSKRFDIGTLDLRPEGYDSLNPNARASMGHLGQSAGNLPPLTAPPMGSSGLLAQAPPPLRNRDGLGNTDSAQGHHSWPR